MHNKCMGLYGNLALLFCIYVPKPFHLQKIKDRKLLLVPKSSGALSAGLPLDVGPD